MVKAENLQFPLDFCSFICYNVRKLYQFDRVVDI